MNAYPSPSKDASSASVSRFAIHATLIVAMGIGYIYSFAIFKMESRDFIELYLWKQRPDFNLPLAIDFKSGGNSNLFRKSDWSEPENWGTWTDGSRPILKIKLNEKYQNKTLTAQLKIHFQHLEIHGQFKLYANGKHVKTWASSDLLLDAYYEFPIHFPKDREAFIIEFRIKGAHAPDTDDERILGIGIEELLLSEAPSA